MTHLVDTMAYVSAVLWHGLGNALIAGQSINVWAKQAGMDWKVREVPVHFMIDSTGCLNTSLPFPRYKVLYRSDMHAPLSVVSQRLHVVSRVFANQEKTSPCRANEPAITQAMTLCEEQGNGAELAAAYSLLNAVAANIDHERRAKSPEHRLDSAWFGQGAHLKQTALDKALVLLT